MDRQAVRRLNIDVSCSLASLTRRPSPPGQAESLSNVHHQLSEQPYRGLSDEVLAQILEELHSAYQEDCIGVPPLGYLTISKRLHNIARPIWLSSLSTRDDAEYADRPIAKLMMDASLRPLVRQLELKLHGAFSQTQTAILTMLDNLRILEVYFDISWSKGSSEARILPATLLNAIASRPHLEELYFYQLVEAEDHRSEAANKRPLRVFTAPIHSIKGSLLEYLNARQVRTLNLTVLLNHNEPFTGKLPWEELSSVNFVIFALQNGQAATSDVPEALGRQVRMNKFLPLSLRFRLGARADSVSPAAAGSRRARRTNPERGADSLLEKLICGPCFTGLPGRFCPTSNALHRANRCKQPCSACGRRRPRTVESRRGFGTRRALRADRRGESSIWSSFPLSHNIF